ncbi:aldehyde dehydrogenase [Paenibacillus sp. GD4]|uniref:aldehyde dehydrogenase n=1 Tax=Paenibacillus sp. GD4 TaxID=3068890 RepID=UPI002796899C|nr:aldehyde dehydrogenase [Paenibacillus sp. GD4]MDQ1913365.1 aldehyde dehydrogenase [Paenibacillus sp. GD4]
MNISNLINQQRAYFRSGATREVSFRTGQLQKLYDLVKRSEAEVTEALAKDFAKPPFETFVTEVGFLLAEIRHAMKHVQRWAKPRKVSSSMALLGSAGFIVPEPRGVSLIIAPWNYPFQLALAPLVGSIAAGNCAILKPSELTPHTSALIARLCKETFDPEYVAVVEGGVEASTELLEQAFDLIFFTGNTGVGRVVMEAAAKHLTPVVLELGGKSPTLVHNDAKLELAAKRIVWGKFLNAGQTCVAPDYVLVHRSVRDRLVQELSMQIREMYGDVLADGSRYPAIVNDRHFERLTAYLKDGVPVYGGRSVPELRRIEPTLLTEVDWSSRVMQDEIFGPILPILEYDDLEEAIAQVVEQPKPLALYLFTESTEVQEKVIQRISFGGGCINDTIMHLSSPYLPFGGVGPSGTGAYHGKFSFDAFSHAKGVLKQTTRFDISIRYGRTERAMSLLKRLLR